MKRAFIALIKKELDELDPLTNPPVKCTRWCHHLKKKFMHEAILVDASNNRDFILSIDQQLAYSGMQMWLHFHKAEKAKDSEVELINYHGDQWVEYLERFVNHIHRRGKKDSHCKCKTKPLHAEWKKVVDKYKEERSKQRSAWGKLAS
jgi:hypothetical protein